MDQNEFDAQDFSFLLPREGDQDYVPGTWVFLTEDGVSEGFLTKFDALMGHLEWSKGAKAAGKDPGGTIVQVSSIHID